MIPGPSALILLFQVEACVCCSDIYSLRLFQTTFTKKGIF
ncbi:hypothetical protein HMPREF1051_0137 [Neisseria sicca VK64]|uniref:Uncharacterized protein n=1 Tax=Neisseria sicca VK64 TaxID=1095748 RepID=I2NE33_NEISI|nr:hypothetical protein HMPREF1051_0137 [Neisseria sicca VK64]